MVERDYPIDQNVYALFIKRSKVIEDKIAVIAEDESVSYKQLAERADAIGEHLLPRIESEQPIGVFTGRTVNMIAAMLGIWKAGGAYVPLDPDDPPERNRRILAIANCEMVLIQPDFARADIFDSNGENIITQELVSISEILTHTTTTPATEIPPGGARLAYIMFTSGSSGAPKGVEVEHSCVINLLYSFRDLIEFSSLDCFLAVSTIGFDVSVAEIFLPLITGGTVLLRDRSILVDMQRLTDEILQFGVTIFQTGPAVWSLIVKDYPTFPKLRVLISTGEAISNRLASKLIPYGDQIWNMYGPTEATVWATGHRITNASLDPTENLNNSAPIGRALANTTLVIVNSDEQIARHGERGELFIGGSGVARGYCNDQTSTNKNFRQFGPNLNRVYRTGDLVALREDGELLYFGRNDDQFSIRGVRIEPAEIEVTLINHPAIMEAAVTWYSKSSGMHAVVAALVVQPDQTISVGELQEWLSLRLAVQMIPSRLLYLQNLPLTPSGKIDRKRIRNHAKSRTESDNPLFERELTATEFVLIGIWKRLLRVSSISVTDNFLSVGGDSLAAIQMITRVEQELGVSLSFKLIFDNLQLEQLAARIDGEEEQQVRSNFIFPLHEVKEKRPLFFSDVDFRLASEGRWTVNCPLYGIAHWVQEKEFLKAKSISELARTHVVAIRQIQAFGPYRIAGQGFGGLVALETAQQLKAQGEKVEFLFLLEPNQLTKIDAVSRSVPLITSPTIVQRTYDLLTYNRISIWVAYQVLHLGTQHNTNPGSTELVPRNLWPAIWGTERRMKKHYIAKPYSGPVLAFFTKREAAYLSWAKVFGSDKGFHILPTGQNDLFNDSSRQAWTSALDAMVADT